MYSGERCRIQLLYPLGGVKIVKTGPLRVVVADGRPLERTLLRFILEENGFEVPAEAGTVLDAVRIVEQQRPDVVVVHENLAREHDVSLLARLREIAPRTNVVLVTKSGTAGVELLEGVDAVIEEGAGLQALSSAVRRASRQSRVPIGVGAIRVVRTIARREPGQTRVRPVRAKGRWLERSQGAIAASIMILGLLFAGGILPGSPSGPLARSPLAAAYDSLQTLVDRLPEASPEHAAQTTRLLVAQRAVAVASALDVSALDRQIRELLLPLLPELPPETAAVLVAVLGDLVGAEVPPLPEPSAPPSPTTEPQPSPEPSPTETPTPEPSPTETPTPEPSPTETPSPSPTETPTPEPSPTETPSPSPTETPSPSPTETPSPSPTEIARGKRVDIGGR